jgi:long-chain acyl-CoA synthetase
MTSSTRLFDLLDFYVRRFPNKPMLHAKINKEWQGQTATEVQEQVMKLASTLISMGLNGKTMEPEKQDKIAIIANNRPEWIITDFAIQLTGSVTVPIYPAITAEEWAYILNESEVKLLFVSDKMIYRKLMKVKDQLKFLTHIYAFDTIADVPHWTELVQPVLPSSLEAIERNKKLIQPEHLVTIIYTSGTTGNPKGVMLSHRNIMSNVHDCMEVFNFCSENENVLSFLPLNHIFERTVMNIYIHKGVSIYFAEGMETIGNDLRDVKPVVFTTVPRLLEKVYEKIDEKGSALTGFKRKIFDWSVRIADGYTINTRRSIFYKIQLALADKLVYTKWREAVGGNIKAIVTGSAACQVRLLRLFTAAKIVVMEGYGLTETSPVISVNRYWKNQRMFGSVGPLIPNVEARLAEDGEIVCRGNNVMMGYYKHPEQTAEVIKDGWFHTGDIGELVDGKFLKITDRKKEIFKISGGKYVAPLPIENKMKESAFIEQIMVVGSNEKFAGALIVPAREKIKEYFSKLNIPIDTAIDFTTDKDVYKLLRSELDKFNPIFAAHEQVKKFRVVDQEWTIDGGELTATMKLKRRKIMEKYGHLVTEIYA